MVWTRVVCGRSAAFAVMAATAVLPGQALSAPDYWLADQPPVTGPSATPGTPMPPSSVPGAGFPGAAQAMGEQAARYWLPSLGADAPDWLKRTELDGHFGSDGKPEYSILTVQPLRQSADKVGTLFVQGSQLHYALFGTYRDTTNLGLGYRRLLLDKTLLIGGNGFYDREWTYGHQRVGFGADAMWRMLDFHANDYLAVTHDRTVGDSMVERAMNGWDAEARSQIPFLPWAKFGVQRYVWMGQFSNVKGWAYTLDMDLTQNVSMELGSRTAALPGTNSDGSALGSNLFATVSFHLGNSSRPVAASSDFISDHPFVKAQDLSVHTLDKVRRENRIIVERTIRTNGITVVVGRSG